MERKPKPRAPQASPADLKGTIAAGDTTRLRLLATTDIHMQLLGHDYVDDRKLDHHGFAGVATLIARARAEAEDQRSACLLFDNGDLLQGSAMGDWMAGRSVDADHAVVRSLNHLRYDAVGVGNHDLDYGLTYLLDIAGRLDMPMICSNLDPSDALSPLTQSALIDCPLPCGREEGNRTIRVGVLSVLPAHTAIWNRYVLSGKTDVVPPLDCLRRKVPALRKAGADIVILLAHVGISGPDAEMAGDDALRLAKVLGIDAVITGHTHQRFPGEGHSGRTGVDADTGTLASRPAIMPGFAGSDLAVLDLTLNQRADGTWHVTDHVSRLRRNDSHTPADPAIVAACAPAHAATRAYLATPVGRASQTLHNYFSLAIPTSTAALTARAKARVIRAAVAGTRDAALPLLAAVSAHTAGGRGGPDNYLHIPEGDVLQRHLTGLSPYVTEIWALRVTGADLHRRLERAAMAFAFLQPDAPDQTLSDPDVPTFNFETIFGLTCRIDPTKPPGLRVTALSHEGRPVAPHKRFLLVTNDFRAAGGGGFDAYPETRVALRSPVSVPDALRDALAHPDDRVWHDHTPWAFGTPDGVRAVLRTAPAALDWLDDIAHLAPEPLGRDPEGFARIRLTL